MKKDNIKNIKQGNTIKKSTNKIDTDKKSISKENIDKKIEVISVKIDNSKEVDFKKLYNADTAKNFIFKKVKAKKSYAGLGLFAMEDIKSGEIILEYIGNILLGDDVDSIENKYLFQVSKNKTIDGSPRWNIGRYINHSCDGNAESEIKKGKVFIKAIKDIKSGEEIVYDYGEEYVAEYFKKHGCLCNAEKHKYIKA